MNIDTTIQKRALHVLEFKNVIETKNIWAKIATTLISTAKNLYSPFTSITEAKTHTTQGIVPLGTSTIGKDELVLDRYIGNSFTHVDGELNYDNFNSQAMLRGDLYASIIKKGNIQATSDFVADATAISETLDFSTSDLVREFLIKVNSIHTQTVGVMNKIDGATVKRAEKHGKAFIACGSDAFVQITSKIASVTSQSSLIGLDGNFVETPYGVCVINLGEASDNPKRVIFGTAGVPVRAFREDKIKVDVGTMVSEVTAGENDLDITTGDNLISQKSYMLAQTKGKNGIYNNVSQLVSSQLIA